MRPLIAALAVALALAGCATSSGPPRAPVTAKPIDAARFYTGQWHEIGRLPMRLTDGCVAGSTFYTPKADGGITVLDDCHQGTPDGKRKTIGGPAVILDPGANAKLRVRYSLFGLPIVRQYWVLDRADDYSWFISADPPFNQLWIYTRDPRPAPALVRDLTDRARALGYDVTRLEFPAQ